MSDVTNIQTPVKPRKKKKKKKILRRLIAWSVTLAILAGGGYALYRFLNSGNNQVSEIYASPAYIGTIQSKVSGSGVARSKESAAITLSQSGVVQEVLVSQGDTVFEGQPLYRVFSQAAQDEVTKAQEKLERLEGELADIQAGAADLTVRAPFAGKLIDVRKFGPEQQVIAGETVATLVNDKKLRLPVYFSYAYENDIFVGQEVTVSVPAVMGIFTGTVEKINRVSYISPEGGVHFEVVCVFDNPGTLTAGMTARNSTGRRSLLLQAHAGKGLASGFSRHSVFQMHLPSVV